MNSELQAHATTLLDKITYQDNVITDVEDKNKRLTDLLNSHLYDQAQNYKETVLSRLVERRRSPRMEPADVTPDRVQKRRNLGAGYIPETSPFNGGRTHSEETASASRLQ